MKEKGYVKWMGASPNLFGAHQKVRVTFDQGKIPFVDPLFFAQKL